MFSFSQEMKSYEGNYTSFRDRSPKITEELKEMTPLEFHSNPEFGILPYDAPCSDCYELIHKRTDTTKYFVENGTFGGKFYAQTLLGTFHYVESGYTKSYHGYIQEINNDFYAGYNQDTPTFIDLSTKTTGFILGNERFSFNNNLTLDLVKINGSVVSLGIADWSVRTIGENGMRIINAWPNIDITIDFGLDRIKTNYIIKASIGNLSDVKYLRFSDEFILPQGTSIQPGETEYFDTDNNRIGDYTITNSTNQELFTIHPAFGFDASGMSENSRSFFYELNNNQLATFVPVQDWLATSSIVYPVTIDPQVNSTATFTGGQMSFQYNGAWCGLAGSCNYNLVVARPPNSTITGTTFSMQYQSVGGFCFWNCYQSEAAFKITSLCGISPAPAATYWNCNTNAAGTCTGTNIDVFPELGTCLGAACSGNVTFQVQNSYCYCSSGGNCGNNCQRMPNNTWSMTLIGTNLQTLGNTATGNGSQTISPVTCSGTTNLNPAPNNGVPGYTYSWSTGATTPTTTVPSYGSSPVTCTVTDACGVSRVATFIIICPLGIEYKYISANKKANRTVEVEWETIEEKNNDYFTLFKSYDGISFEAIAVVPSKGQGDFNYSMNDPNSSLSDVLYYKLMNTSLNGESESSALFKVDFNESESDLTIVPNPTSGMFHLKYNVPYSGLYTIELVDALGKIISSNESELKIGNVYLPYDLRNYPKGIYTVSIRNKTNTVKQRVVIQ